MSAKTRAATADIRCDSCHKPDLGEVRNDHVNKTVPASRPKSDCITRNPHECGASMAAKRLGICVGNSRHKQRGNDRLCARDEKFQVTSTDFPSYETNAARGEQIFRGAHD